MLFRSRYEGLKVYFKGYNNEDRNKYRKELEKLSEKPETERTETENKRIEELHKQNVYRTPGEARRAALVAVLIYKYFISFIILFLISSRNHIEFVNILKLLFILSDKVSFLSSKYCLSKSKLYVHNLSSKSSLLIAFHLF